jgi:mannose/fructose-specific phosphotransferase system component IIA
MEDLDEEEKLAVLTDMMSSSPVSNKVDIVKQSWQ